MKRFKILTLIHHPSELVVYAGVFYEKPLQKCGFNKVEAHGKISNDKKKHWARGLTV